MGKLLKIEWLKIKGYPTFWIIVGLFAALLPLFAYQLSSGRMNMGAPNRSISLANYSFPSVYSHFPFWASVFVTFIGFIIIILITNEFRFKTHRQNMIDGWTRLQVLHAKCLLIVILAIATTFYTGFWCIIFGGINSLGGFTFWLTDIEKLGYFFVLCLNYFGFALLLSFLVKRSGLAIGIYMAYAFIIEFILKVFLNWQFKDTYIGTFLPLQSSDELLPFPLLSAAERAVSTTAPPSPQTYLIVSITYVALYYIIARRRILKSDW
jgi:ABC-2 type transport system permease protein